MRRLWLLSFAIFFSALLWMPARADEKDPNAEDETRLKNSGQGTDGPSLVAFLSSRAKGDLPFATLKKLIDDLDSKDAAVRQKAGGQLVAVGSLAVPLLRQLARDSDTPETAALARRILGVIEDDSGALSVSTIRLLVARRPAGTPEALLAYLPHAENDTVREELRSALAAVAYDKGVPEPALLKALEDEHPMRRAAAITAICSTGKAEPRATLRKLLGDPSPSVRLRASFALAAANDAKAVSTLVTLLTDLPLEQGKEVETYLNELAGELAPKVTLGADETSRVKTRDAWATWWLATEGDASLEEVKKRTLSEADMTNSQNLIERLGDDSFDVRQKAEEDLKKLGSKIIPILRTAMKNGDLEIRGRVAKLLSNIEADKATPLSAVTCRLIALRKPKGAVESLLAYMPFADETVAEDLQTALNSVAFPGGKADPALIKALEDKAPARRQAAGLALCSGPLADNMDNIRKTLKDKDLTVRLRVAMALAMSREVEGVPVVIELVGELPGEGSGMAEEFLLSLAKEDGPKDLPEGEDNRKKRAKEWEKWWDAKKDKVAMLDRMNHVIRERYQGLTILVQSNNGQIQEWDKDGKVRWTITGLNNPWDAQMLKSNRILITEYGNQTVSERDLKGNILWKVTIPGNWPMQAERLSNGQTFVVCRNELLQYDRGGRQVFKFSRPAGDIMSARRLPNGKIVMVTSNRQIVQLDRAGKEVATATVPNVYYNQNEILDNGNVIVPLGWNNTIIEYDLKGKEVWRASCQQPMHAMRAANGTTVVSSQNWPYQIIDLDKKGTQVSTRATGGLYVFRVKRR
jgi:HEAT repeat protein